MDEASDALIAQLMWADQAGYGYGSDDNRGNSEDSDYSKGKKKRRAPKGCKGAKKQPGNGWSPRAEKDGSRSEPRQQADLEDDEQNKTVSGRRKRKDAGQERTKGRPWTDDEETKFMESLDLYGRDWKKCADHVGTRDAKAFTSHAQKYFIKLCLQGKALPAKVAASGIGYTLSGKLLEPNSAAAKAYGFKPEIVLALTGSALETALAGLDVSKLEGLPNEAVENAKAVQFTSQASAPAPAPAPRESRPTKRQKRKENDEEDDNKEKGKLQEAAQPVVTEYARNRPRRELATLRNTLGDTSESLDLCECMEFMGAPGSGAPLAQPFTVEVEPKALMAMDFHSHLSGFEIIGLLGGTWDGDQKLLRVVEAYPCRRAAGSHGATSVELDAEAEVEARASMGEKDQRCVGWYHSHPVFAPSPSHKDMDNQRNYQVLFRDADSQLEPFIGFILGPFDLALPAAKTAVTAFVVQKSRAQLQPYNIRYTVVPARGSVPSEIPGKETVDKLLHLLEDYRDDIGRTDFSEVWRPFSELDGHVPRGDPLTKLQKMQRALMHHFLSGITSKEVDLKEVRGFIHDISLTIQQHWQLDLGLDEEASEDQDFGTTPEGLAPMTGVTQEESGSDQKKTVEGNV